MTYIISKKSAKPAYFQLYEQIKNDIVCGTFPLHSKLPSKRTLSSDTGLSLITIEHAYELLCDEGYIESRQRSGYFVIFRAKDGFFSTTKKAPHPHQSYHSDAFAFPFSVFARTVRKVLNNYGSAIFEKSPNAGLLELREALKLYLARNKGIHADTEQIIIGSGAEHLYTLIILLLGRERVFAFETPSYEKIECVYKCAGRAYERLPLVQDGIASEALARTKADVLHISPFRSFPSGITASASKKHEYLCWARKPGRLIIEDDFESEFTILRKPEETLFSLSKHDNVIYLNTFSLTISPSLRVGYMVLPKHLVPRFYDKLGFNSCTVPTFEQLLLLELISNGDFERHVNRVRRLKRKLFE